MRRSAALLGGPAALLLTVLVPAPAGMAGDAWRVAGLAGWMAVWWLTTVIPLEATALLPLVLLPLLGVSGMDTVAPRYADPVIFLFLGGFLLAATLERWELHRRFALRVVNAVGTDAPRVILAFLLVAAFASMWISNTATAVMLLPIAVAVVPAATPERAGGGREDGFPAALMLAVAYGASIGGVATLIGTPPNAILAATARELADVDVTFASWLPIGLSVTIPMLAGCWVLLVRLFGVRGPVEGLADRLGAARTDGPLGSGERFVLGVFSATALAWILRTPKEIGPVRIPGLTQLLPGLSDAGIAIGAALLLFAVPLPRGAPHRTALDWDTARRIPWGILLLFGGGLALAAAFVDSGLSAWIGGRLTGLRGLPVPVVLLATAALFVALTELTSNTATAALGMPLMAGVAGGLALAPLPLMAVAALAASMAFMLPVATPPNAIVFGSGRLTAGQMARAGLGLNLLAVVVTTVVVWVWL